MAVSNATRTEYLVFQVRKERSTLIFLAQGIQSLNLPISITLYLGQLLFQAVTTSDRILEHDAVSTEL